jgi:hypothetical protein
MNKDIKILHTADIQVKSRIPYQYIATEKTLLDIEKILSEQKYDIYIISGDLFEYGNTGSIIDSERDLIYSHLVRCLSIPTLGELVIISGNHDVIQTKFGSEDQANNPLSLFDKIIATLPKSIIDVPLNTNLLGTKIYNVDKLRYLKKSGIYNSIIGNSLKYIVYSLEDSGIIQQELLDQYIKPTNTNIILWHGMLKEFVDSEKIPLRSDIYKNLKSLTDFPNNSLVASGDIHKRLVYKNPDIDVTFIYPGSPLQHTHSEGSYINIDDEYTLKDAETKALRSYNYDGTKLTTFKEIELPNHIRYYTFQLNHKTPIDIIKFNINKFMIDNEFKLDDCIYKIKIKTANVFLKYEQEIRELFPIDYELSFDYEKFVQESTYQENSTIAKIIEEKSEELRSLKEQQQTTEIITSENVDNLILNRKQLLDLFSSILKPLLSSIKNEFSDDITINDITSDITNLFDQELQKVTEKESNRYNIVFKSIYTNGFMLLGENKINLDIPGIIRILGTNGIGKTTLYNMIRWVITGSVYENMPQNTVLRNTLYIFNNRLPDNNLVNVELELTINNTPVYIKRTAERKWKNNINPEQKIQEGWENLVSTVDRDLTINICNKNTETINKTGETAQKYIDLWFGKTINNIAILNQQKIEKLLKSNPDDLNELILDFIGVEYLKKLDEDLTIVKDELMTVSKPKQSKEDIFEAQTDTKLKQKSIIDNRLIIESSIKEIQESLLKQEEEKTKLYDELINLGNIPEIIKTKNIELTKINSDISNFKPKELLVPKIVENEKPVINNEFIAAEEIIIANNKLIIDNNIITLDKLNIKYDEICEQLINDKSIIDKNIDIKISELNNKLQSQKSLITKYYQECVIIFNDLLDKLKNKENEKKENLSILLNSNATILSDNYKYQEEISSGICSKCNRPFSDDWDNRKLEIEAKITENLNLIESNQIKIKELQLLLDSIKEKIRKIEPLRDASIANRKDCFLYSNEELKKLQENIVNGETEIENIESEILQEINEKHLLVFVDTIKFQLPIDNNICVELIPKVEILRKIVTKKTELFNNNEVSKTYIEKSELSLKEYNAIYITKLNKYNDELILVNQYNSEISQKNQEISEHNNSINTLVAKKSELTAEIMVLEGNKLPKYNEKQEIFYNLTQEILANNNKQNELNQKINEFNLKDLSYTKELELLTKTYEQLIQYTKNQIIWKIYSKLIKSNFKDIVFDYYRTYLNNTLNYLLSDVSFKLFWNYNSELIFNNIKDGVNSVTKVQSSSGMEIAFMGLSLIYTMHILNVKNNISHIFIDELSGTLNNGNDLSYNAMDYQELFVKIINKFQNKSIFIVDHHIKNMFETVCYEVVPDVKGSQYILKT